MRLDYCISEVAPYINWIYFFHAWGTSNMPQQDKALLKAEAEERLQHYSDDYTTHALFLLLNAQGENDDIVVDDGRHIPCLRQQQAGSDYRCLADFVTPNYPQVGIFATTVDMGLETDFNSDPYEKMMMQLIADRLAEATAERLHEEVRKRYWGYAPDEQLSIPEMQAERWQGIRPAVGYPSLPDTSLNFILDGFLNMKQIGIRLTVSGAMKPHASVSGLMLAHPQAHYFSIGTIGEDQLADYAHRRGLPVEQMRKYLAGNL
jgi:cobalamin-dependent methionine synthase I